MPARTHTGKAAATAPRTPGQERLSPSPAVIAHLRSRLKARDLRCTGQRIAIVTLLACQDAPGHLSAPQIHSRLLEQGHDVDASTIYRSLTTLVDIGILHATSHPDQPASYGLVTTPHHHALCSRCGQLTELPAGPLRDALKQAARLSEYAFDDESLLLRGICPTCRTAPTITATPHT